MHLTWSSHQSSHNFEGIDGSFFLLGKAANVLITKGIHQSLGGKKKDT